MSNQTLTPKNTSVSGNAHLLGGIAQLVENTVNTSAVEGSSPSAAIVWPDSPKLRKW